MVFAPGLKTFEISDGIAPGLETFESGVVDLLFETGGVVHLYCLWDLFCG